MDSLCSYLSLAFLFYLFVSIVPCAKIVKIVDTEDGNGKKVCKKVQFSSLHTAKWMISRNFAQE